MPIYFKKLENILEKWIKTMAIKKPTNDRASMYSYKSMQKAAKKIFLKELLEIFSEVDIIINTPEYPDDSKRYTIFSKL